MINIEWDTDITVEAYKPLYDSKAFINLIWGGRDGAKTHNLGDILLYKCLSQDYFKCILTRKVQDTIRGSMYSVIKSAIDRHGLGELFHMTKSPLEIICKNGNMFIGIGADDPGKIKSTENPTDVWCEEADQIPMDAIDIILTTLRANNVDAQAWFSLNPEINPKTGNCDILKRFVPDYDNSIHNYYSTSTEPNLSEWTQDVTLDIGNKEVVETMSFLSLHTTLDHNPYCPPSRAALYESYKGVDDNKYNVWRWGRLGTRTNEMPFFSSFNENKHVIDVKYRIAGDLPLLVMMDFNWNPCTAIIGQLAHAGLPSKYVENGFHLYETIQVKGGTEALCDEIIARGLHEHIMLLNVTGDNSGNSKKSSSLHTDSEIVENKLRTKMNTKRGVNERHAHSRTLCNYFMVHGKLFIYKEGNAVLISDLKSAERKDDGSLLKDRKQHPQDAGDAFRYGIHEFIGIDIEEVRRTINLININN